MSVLIKGMDMPENCFQCPCLDGEYCVCQAVDSYEKIESIKFRPPYCPLVEVPKHGRLVDADAIRKDIDKQRPSRKYEDAWALTIIDFAPTVIESEE